MPRAKKFYLVTASNYGYDEYDSIVVVAYSESQAVRLALEKGGPGGLNYPHFDESQGPFSAEYFSPFKYKTGDKPIASFNAG
jgi:hypothetical protein